MKLIEMITRLKVNLTQSVVVFDAGTALDFEFDISPKEFLTFSKKDLASANERGYINALSNAKRAIDCQTDKVIKSLGIDLKDDKLPHACMEFLSDYKKNNSTPLKLIFLEALGFAPVNLVAKSRTIRNKLEHEYRKPSEAEVKDAIELADLFILATNSKLGSVWNFCLTDKEHSLKDESGFTQVLKGLNFFYDNHAFIVADIYPKNLDQTEISISNLDVEFYYLIKIATSSDYSEDIRETLIQLLKKIGHPMPGKNIKVMLASG